jgi:hypothetical protein
MTSISIAGLGHSGTVPGRLPARTAVGTEDPCGPADGSREPIT